MVIYINLSTLHSHIFSFSSIVGGFTGLILANSIIDIIPHDPYFVIGHFHLVLSLGAIYTISSAFYLYRVFFPTISFPDSLGRIHFGSSFISSNSISFTMHSLGIIGFPRRIYDYSLLFWTFHRFNPFGIIGIYLSMTVLLLLHHYNFIVL